MTLELHSGADRNATMTANLTKTTTTMTLKPLKTKTTRKNCATATKTNKKPFNSVTYVDSSSVPTIAAAAAASATTTTDDRALAIVSQRAHSKGDNSMPNGNFENGFPNGNIQRQQLTPLLYELWTGPATTNAVVFRNCSRNVRNVRNVIVPATTTSRKTHFAHNVLAAASPLLLLTTTTTTILATTTASATFGSALTASIITTGAASTATTTTTATKFSTFLTTTPTTSTSATTNVSQIDTTNALSDVDSYLIGMAWPKALAVAIFLFLILLTVIGNTLVILAVLTTRRLRTVTNCFVMNLAITDWLVGTCVMPPAVILYIVGKWRFGWILCDIWISLDVLLCTGSILSLCAISLDRYLAVTQPLTYSKKRRSKRLALFMIFIVWVTALSITCPPYLGWYEPGRRQAGYVVCRYNQNKGYVVFSAMGSFFIPLSVMLYVYLKIGYVLTSRRQRIVRDANSERTADNDIDCDNFLSESEQFHCATPKFPSFKARWGGVASNADSKNNSLKCSKCNKSFIDQTSLKHQASFYELVEISRLSSLIHCSAMGCKYGTTASACMHGTAIGASSLPRHLLQHNDSHASFTETCLAGITTMPATTPAAAAATTGIQLNPSYCLQHQQLQNHIHSHHLHQHHAQRIPMRISTTKRDTKTAKTLTIVMGGFIACWLPFFVYYLLIPFLPAAYVFEGLMSFLTWVGWINCAINPFIYAFYNPDFRTAFWRLTCRRVCKQKTPAHHMAMFRG